MRFAGMRDEAVMRAGAAAIARATGAGFDEDTPEDVGGGDESARKGNDIIVVVRPTVVLPDECVMRILRVVLEHTGGEDAHRVWSVGARFRVPARDTRRRSVEGAVGSPQGNRNDASQNESTSESTKTTTRSSLRLVCKQWRRILDSQCNNICAKKAVMFGDDALVGLAETLCQTNGVTKITLQGSHLTGGEYALTSFGLSRACNCLTSLTHLHIDRTGMDVGDVLQVATSCVNLIELRINGATDNGNISNNDNPFESALLHEMPHKEDTLDKLGCFFSEGSNSLERVTIRGVPDLFRVHSHRSSEMASQNFEALVNGLTFSELSSDDFKEIATRKRLGCKDPTIKAMLLSVCAALNGCTNLRRLELEDVGASDTTGMFIVQALPPTLEVFTIGGDDVGARTGAALAKKLATDKNPALWQVRLPRNAGLGAVAALELDAAFRQRSENGRSLFVRLTNEEGCRLSDAVVIVAEKVLSPWVSSKENHLADVRLSTEASGDRLNKLNDSKTAVAKEVLRHLATHETADFDANDLAMTGNTLKMTRWSPQRVYAATGPCASRATLTAARDWFEQIQKDDSLASTAVRVAVTERFASLALLLETSTKDSLYAHDEIDTATKDYTAFAQVALDVLKFPSGLEIPVSSSTPLPRALASAALPEALALAAANDDARRGLGRDASHTMLPPLPDAIIDQVHAKLCVFLIAVDLWRMDVCVQNEKVDKADTFLTDACYANGGAWAMLEVTRRHLLGDSDEIFAGAITTSPWIPFTEATGIPIPHRFHDTFPNDGSYSHRIKASEYLSPQMLPRWISAGLNGSSSDASIAAEVAASALFTLSNHTLDARQLQSLALILGSAAKLLPDDGDGCRLHDAVHAVFASREFAPLYSPTRMRFLPNNKHLHENSILSWPQWLHAVGAPPPMDESVARRAAANLLEREMTYARLEAEVASVKAKMDRIAGELRTVSTDLRLSQQFHREPARVYLLKAHRLIRWEYLQNTVGISRQTKLFSQEVRQTPRRHDTITRVPVPGWREEVAVALDALFTHCETSAPFVAALNDADAGTKGWSKVNDVSDTSRVFHHEWERKAAATMLAWYVDTHRKDDAESRVGDVLRVLGERLPVEEMLRLRREANQERADDASHSFARSVELDSRARWNLLLDDEDSRT